jgi:hypothetical protein
MKTFFLSASIPLLSRHSRFYSTADVVAIRESLRGLVAAVLPSSRIVFGGHPAITPLIRLMAKEMELSVHDHVVLYQSRFFQKDFPEDNSAFERIVLTEEKHDREASLDHMRHRMLSEHTFDGAVFIGGMEGIIDEWELFGRLQKDALRLPVATTGAAARVVFNETPGLPSELATEYAYLHLFRRLLLGNRA